MELPIGPVSINLRKLFLANDYEGIRPGLALCTNDSLSRIFSVGGYIGYGTRDKEEKYNYYG